MLHERFHSSFVLLLLLSIILKAEVCHLRIDKRKGSGFEIGKITFWFDEMFISLQNTTTLEWNINKLSRLISSVFGPELNIN